MPSDDLILNVRQIENYTSTSSAQPTDALLIQRGGLGGPYYSIAAENFVATALSQGGPLMIGNDEPPLSAFDNIFAGGLVFGSGGYIAANIYEATDVPWRFLTNGPGAVFGITPDVGFVIDFASGGAAGAPVLAPGIAFIRAMTLTPAGAMTLNIGTLSVARDPVSPLEVATARFVAANTVGSFNGRTGAVTLNLGDILGAGGAPIFSPRFGGQPRAQTPPPGDNSSWLATTAFVQATVRQQLDLSGYALLDSPNFIGVPTAPTASAGSSDGQLATTAFVQNAVAESVTGVATFNARTGNVVLTLTDITSAGGAPLASPTFTGTPAAPTRLPGDSSGAIATTQFVAAAIAAVAAGVSSFNTRTGAVVLTSGDIAAVGVSSFNGRLGAVNLIGNDVSAAGGALNASPAFTGTPTAPTAIPATNTTQIATTAFVQAAVSAATAGVVTWNGRAGAVVLTAADVTGVNGALLASPTFTGVPAAPTAAPGANTTQLATTAFVQAAVAAGTAGVASFNTRTGVVTLIANDLSAAGGALLASPIFTGTPTGPTASPGTATAQLATCAFVNAAIAAGVTSFNGRTGAITLTTGDVNAAGGPYLQTAGGTIGASGLAVTGPFNPAAGITGIGDGSNAGLGDVGEVLSFINATPVTLGSGTVSNTSSIALTPGDWDIMGEMVLTASGQNIVNYQVAINNVSGTIPGTVAMGSSRTSYNGSASAPVGTTSIPLSPCRANVTTTTTYFIMAFASFSTGTVTATGKIWARRRR